MTIRNGKYIAPFHRSIVTDFCSRYMTRAPTLKGKYFQATRYVLPKGPVWELRLCMHQASCSGMGSAQAVGYPWWKSVWLFRVPTHTLVFSMRWNRREVFFFFRWKGVRWSYFIFEQNKTTEKRNKLTQNKTLDYTVRLSSYLATSLRFNTRLIVNIKSKQYYVHICKKCYK